MGRFDHIVKKSPSEDQSPVLAWEECFAKSTDDGGAGISVALHCELAGRISLVLARAAEALLPKGYPFIVAAHDVGKVSPGFLKHCSNRALRLLCAELAAIDTEARSWEKNHCAIGEASFCAWAAHNYGHSFDWMAWAEVIGIHHGHRSTFLSDGNPLYGGPSWAEERYKLLSHLLKLFSVELPTVPPTRLQKKLLAGLTCVSDWIASNEACFPNLRAKSTHIPQASIAEAVADCGWTPATMRHKLCFKDVFGFDPYPMQKSFIDCVDRRGVYVLEAPMGQGKTEAALFAAYKLMESGQNSGLYFGLPTRLTSDRIHQRVEAFMDVVLENPDFVKLIHGHAWMNLESKTKEFQAGKSWFSPHKRALLAPFGVGTIDQALMSVLKVKHHFVRTFGLAGKVVILDEVHSYDAYTGTLLNCLVEELVEIGCSVIILSATLTADRREDFLKSTTPSNAYPLVSTTGRWVAPPPPADRCIELRWGGLSAEGLIERAVSAAERGLCVLWIANTVASSQEILRKVNAERKEDSFKTGLLHSRFPAFRRAELEDDWIDILGKDGDRPNGCILVATQVVEQSVDIDADMLITELAPSDMLLQRMGRLCRHERPTRPDGSGFAWIYGADEASSHDADLFKDALGPSQYVYAPYVLWKTVQTWKNRERIHLPSDIRELIESTYADCDELPEWVSDLQNDLNVKKEKLEGAALGLTQIFCGDDDEDANTRYSTRPTIPALLVRELDDCGTFAEMILCDGTSLSLKAGERDFNSAVAVHQNMVSLPMPRGLDPRVPSWLKTTVFGPVWVLQIKDNDLLDLDGLDAPWGYHPNTGVYKRKVCTIKPAWELEDEDESYY